MVRSHDKVWSDLTIQCGQISRYSVVRSHDIVVRSHDIVVRSHDIMARSHEIVVRSHDIVVRSHDIVVRSHDSGQISRYSGQIFSKYLNRIFSNINDFFGRISLVHLGLPFFDNYGQL